MLSLLSSRTADWLAAAMSATPGARPPSFAGRPAVADTSTTRVIFSTQDPADPTIQRYADYVLFHALHTARITNTLGPDANDIVCSLNGVPDADQVMSPPWTRYTAVTTDVYRHAAGAQATDPDVLVAPAAAAIMMDPSLLYTPAIGHCLWAMPMRKIQTVAKLTPHSQQWDTCSHQWDYYMLVNTGDIADQSGYRFGRHVANGMFQVGYAVCPGICVSGDTPGLSVWVGGYLRTVDDAVLGPHLVFFYENRTADARAAEYIFTATAWPFLFSLKDLMLLDYHSTIEGEPPEEIVLPSNDYYIAAGSTNQSRLSFSLSIFWDSDRWKYRINGHPADGQNLDVRVKDCHGEY